MRYDFFVHWILEILSAVIFLLLLLYIRLYFKSDRSQLQPTPIHHVDIKDLRTGDLLVIQGRICKAIHPGHLAMVVRHPIYHQVCVFDHGSTNSSEYLKPFGAYIQQKKYFNQIFLLRYDPGTTTTPTIDDTTWLSSIRQHTRNIKYDYTAVLSYLYVLVHEYFLLPTPSWPTSTTSKYCSEIIMDLFIDLGVVSPHVWDMVPHHGLLLPTDIFLCQYEKFNTYVTIGHFRHPIRIC